MESLAVKYRPKDFDEVTSQSDTIAILRHQLEKNKIRNAYLFSGASGCGKALRVGTRVFTNKGWVNIENLNVNYHLILGTDGKFHKLNGIYFQGRRRVYRTYFDCGLFVDNDLEHLWTVNDKNKSYTFTVKELIEKLDLGKKYHLPLVETANSFGLEYDKEKLYADLFVLISNFGYCYYSKPNNNFIYTITVTNDKVKQLLLETCKKYNLIYKETNLPNRVGKLGEVYEIFGDLLSNIPFKIWQEIDYIPSDFLCASNEAREEMLQIFLKIYYPHTNHNYIFVNSKRNNYLKDLRALCHSLGYKSTLGVTKKGLFQLLIRNNKQLRCNYVRMKNIMDMGFDDEMVCIDVDTEDHLYVIEGFIATHNTTVARILANKINHNKGKPIEMDAASNNGVDDVRKIIEEARFKSITSEYKVYIIDECHSVTTNGWQAFLKILEEPPLKTVFIFCTTEPHKLPKTILNRVQRYDFYRMTKDEIIERLKYILENENIKNYHIDALEYIARISFGGMRDAITYLDKVLLYDKELTLKNTVNALSLCEYDVMFDVINNLDNCSKLLQILDNLFLEGKSLKNFIEMLIQFTIDFIKLQIGLSFENVTIPNTYSNFDYNSVKDLRPFLNGLVKLNNNLRYESNPKMLIECFFIEVSNV